MTRRFRELGRQITRRSFGRLLKPAHEAAKTAPVLEAGGDRPLQMTFTDQLDALVYLHLEGFESGRDLLQALEENDFARQEVAPEGGIQKSSFFEILSTRGLEQMAHIFNGVLGQATRLLPKGYAHLGELRAIDGSLISNSRFAPGEAVRIFHNSVRALNRTCVSLGKRIFWSQRGSFATNAKMTRPVGRIWDENPGSTRRRRRFWAGPSGGVQ